MQPNNHRLPTPVIATKVSLKIADRESLTANEQSKALINFSNFLYLVIAVITSVFPKIETAIMRNMILLVT